MSKSDKKFLIRSSGQILGPLNAEEVIDFIKRGVISVFDEIAEPFTIWRYLQDHKDFKEAVRSMDFKTRLTNFITQVSGKVSRNSEVNQTITSTDTLGKTQDTASLSARIDSNQKKKADEVSFEVVDSPKVKPRVSAKYTSQTNSEEIIRKRVSSIIKITWRVVIAFALAIGAYIFYKEVFSPIQQKQAVSKALEGEGFKFYESGNYTQALAYFEEAYSEAVLEDKEKLKLSSLFIQHNKLQKASLILDELSSSPLSKSGDWFLLKGLISFFEKDFSKSENSFKRALKEKQSLALVNLSILKWKQGDYQKSLSYLDSLIKLGYERGLVFYLTALNFASQDRFKELIQYVVQERSNLTIEYQQELYLLLAYAYMKEQRMEEFENTIKNLLNEDPFIFKEYRYNSFLAVKNLNWIELYPYCKNIFESDSQNNLLSALYGFCYLKMGNLKEGSKYIEQVKNKDFENPLFVSLYFYLLMLQGEEFQLEQALDLIIDSENQKTKQALTFILKARFFEQKKDWVRALEVWNQLLLLDNQNLSGTAGIAIANYKLGNYSTGKVFRDRGLKIYPNHVQLLSYDQQAE